MKRSIALLLSFLLLALPLLSLTSCEEPMMNALTFELESCTSFTVYSTAKDLGFAFSRAEAPAEFETVIYGFSGAQFVRGPKERGVAVKYTVCFYDASDKELYEVDVLSDKVVVWKGYEFSSSSSVGLTYLDSLFAGR